MTTSKLRRGVVGLDLIVDDLKAVLADLKAEVTGDYSRPISQRAEHALAHIETFAAVSVRIMRQTNPSKIRDAARAEEIAAYMQGREVLK